MLGCCTVATALVVRRGAAVPCRCFGGDSQTPSPARPSAS
ncbi:hypothetical protein ABT158_32160 [Nonomuraea sp. NPDC001636]